jgi:hypothetical protein
MRCYECGESIQDEGQRVMGEVRMFRLSDTLVPFHKDCWERRRISKAKRHYAKAFAESLILLAVAFVATYVAV